MFIHVKESYSRYKFKHTNRNGVYSQDCALTMHYEQLLEINLFALTELHYDRVKDYCRNSFCCNCGWKKCTFYTSHVT